jgi:hypothetical protein
MPASSGNSEAFIRAVGEFSDLIEKFGVQEVTSEERAALHALLQDLIALLQTTGPSPIPPEDQPPT